MYDTIIIGNDFSSLVAAVESVSHGNKTILITTGDTTGVYKKSGYTFNLDPMPLAGFGEDQMCSRFLSQHHISLGDSADIHLLDPALQIILPHNRLELFHDTNALMREIEREFPDEHLTMQRFYDSMSRISSIIDAWIKTNPFISPIHCKFLVIYIKFILKMAKEIAFAIGTIRTLLNNVYLKNTIEAQLTFLSNLHAGPSKFYSPIYPYILSLPNRGLYYSMGGKRLLTEALQKHFINAGGKCIRCAILDTRVHQKELFVQINGCEPITEIHGQNLIISTKSEILKHLLLSNKKFSRISHRLQSLEGCYSPFTLHMGIHNKGIPEKMCPYVALIVEDGKKTDDYQSIYLELSLPNDINRAPAGKRALSATVFLRKSPLLSENHELEKTSQNILTHLATFLPFLRENMDYLNVDASIEWSRKCQGMVNRKYLNAKPFGGITTLPHQTPLKNVFLTGDMLLPGLGFEGEVISGINAALLTISKENGNHDSKAI